MPRRLNASIRHMLITADAVGGVRIDALDLALARHGVATLDRVAVLVDAPFFATSPRSSPNGTRIECLGKGAPAPSHSEHAA